MINHNYTIEDIMEATGLSRSYIDRCYLVMPFLSSYRKLAPDQNKFMYDSNALSVFQEISSLKKEGYRRGEIAARFAGQQVQSAANNRENTWKEAGSGDKDRQYRLNEEMSNYSYEGLLMSLREAHRETMDTKDELAKKLDDVSRKRLEDKDELIHSLRSQVLLLTDGRSPEVVKAEIEQISNERKKLHSELEQAKKTIESRDIRKQQRLLILRELDQNKSGFFSGKRRRELVKLLSELEEGEGSAQVY